MTTATLGRDPFMPQVPKGRGPALGLALLAHALLILAIAFGVNWRNSEPTAMSAELWSAVPQAAAPLAAEPPPVAAKPEPVVKPVESKPAAPVQPDPQIAIEKAKIAKREKDREKAERDEAERERLRAREEQAQKKTTIDKAKADKERAERDKADRAEAARLAAARDSNLKRMLGQAGATGGPTDAGTAARSSGPSASYAGRIMARIKPNIVFSDSVDGNPMATVEVKLAPDGTIVAKRLVKGSGVRAWDEAVLRAIERTEVLPRDIDGRVPPPFQIDFRLRD